MLKKKTVFLLISVFIVIIVCALIFSLICLRNKPNIIFITLDALRADHLGCYGYKRDTSPSIDLLVGGGALFTQAIAQAPRTVPSNSSMLTSLYPSHETTEKEYSLNANELNLVRILKDNDYLTALFSNAYSMLSLAFEYIKSDFSIFNVAPVASEKVYQSAVDWLSKNPKKPFFLWIYFFDPHGPYIVPSEYYNEFLKDGLYPHKNVPIAQDNGKINEFYSWGVIPRYIAEDNITDIAHYIAKYDGKIKFADTQIGKLLDFFTKNDILDNTIIVIFSDHGESLGEHNFYFNHSHYLYEGLIRVPLAIIFPRKIPKGIIIPKQAQLIDIPPTILALSGIKFPRRWEGKSLLPLIFGKNKSHAKYAFSEAVHFPAPLCIRTQEWKLIYNRKIGNYELYNLKDDPKETTNLVKEHNQVFQELKQELQAWLKNARTYSLQTPAVLREDDRQKLRSLGYAQ